MSQNDLVIANQSAPDFRSDLNDALQALGSLNSGSTAPSTTYANMLWYDTSNNILKMRSEADDAWIDIGTLNQSTNEFEVASLQASPLTKSYESTQFTPAPETVVTLAHGLGEAPKIINWFAICTTADNYFSVGDVLGPFASVQTRIPTSDGTSGVSVLSDSIEIKLLFNSNFISATTEGPTFFTNDDLTYGNWDIKVRAYA